MKKVIFLVLFFAYVTSCDNTKGIEKIENWPNLITGKWEYEREYHYKGNLELRVGEVEYFPDNTFVKTAIIKFYFGYSTREGQEDFIGGGVVKGTWSIDSEKLRIIEEVNYCNINHSLKTSRVKEGFDACEWEYQDKTFIYGDDFTDYRKTELVSFNKNKIKIKSTYFKTAGNEEYSAAKIK